MSFPLMPLIIPRIRTFATLNPSDKNSRITLSNGNLTAAGDASAIHQMVRATVGKSAGQYYWEYTWAGQGNANSGPPINITGIQDASSTTADGHFVSSQNNGCGVGYNDGFSFLYSSATITQSGAIAGSSNGTHGLAFDATNGKLWFTTTVGTWLNGITPSVNGAGFTFSTIPGSTYFPAVSFEGSTPGTMTFNFGASAFSYAVPSGFTPGIFT
jgi:hypothetical protein